MLNTFWLSFDGEKVEELKLASNSENNIDILRQILDSPNRRSLIDGLSAICDDICDVEEEEDDEADIGNEVIVHEDDNEDDEDEDDGKDDMKDGDVKNDMGVVKVIDTAAAWLKNKKKKKKQMEFQDQFCEYFVRLTDESNVKPNLQTFFAIIFVQIGLYWKLRETMLEGSLENDEEQQLVEDVEKYKKMEMIDLSICDEYGQTIFHLAASLDTTKVFDILLEIDRDVAKYQNKLGKSAREEAIKAGQWGIVQNIALSQMGSKKQNKAKMEEHRIESQRAVVKNFLKERQEMLTRAKTTITTRKAEGQKEKPQKIQETQETGCATTKTNISQSTKTDDHEAPVTREQTNNVTCEEDKLLEELLQTQLNLLMKKSPLSDDMLLLVWKYEMSINATGDTNRLWLSLSKIIEEVLDNASNKRDWFWFKTYILQSIV